MRLASLTPIIAGNAIRERIENPVSIKSLLFFGAIIVVVVAFGVVLNIARNKRDEKRAQNLVPFYDDETLETKKLERTLSVGLIAVAVVAVAISAYYVWEPTRQAKMTTSFDTRSVRRGQTLYANVGMVGYSSVQSLSCANCHGGFDEETGRYASGGTAQYTLKSLKDPETDPACADDLKFTNPDCITTSVTWEAPALNTILYKFPILKAEADNPFKSSCRLADQRSTPDCRSQVYDILTYGRPGTPMPAWGVAGGGPKNEQAIDDLVNFLASIQLPEDEAAQPIRSGEIIKQEKKIQLAEEEVEKARETVLASGVAPSGVDQDASVLKALKSVDEAKAALKAIEAKTETDYFREAAIANAEQQVEASETALNEDAPKAVESAKADYEAAKKAYESEAALKAYGNPQDYLDKLDEDQTLINLEKKIEEAKSKKKKAEAKKADLELTEIQRLKNIALNFIESRDALATSNATLEIFAPEAVSNSKARLEQLKNASEGQLLFESNCARCHTKGWSYQSTSNARVPLAAPQGTGAFGPNLAGGDVKLQFINAQDQFNFIANGSIFQAPYGARGIGSGRMPGSKTAAGATLSDDQINAIVEYEREGLTGTGNNSLGVRNLGSGQLIDEEGE